MSFHDRTVLIGDPDQVTSALYQRTLRESFEVFVATDQGTALNILETNTIHVFVLELTLFDDLNWKQLIDVGKRCSTRGTLLVICSTLDERRRGLEIGAVAYLIKPTLPSLLMHTIDSIISGDSPAV